MTRRDPRQQLGGAPEQSRGGTEAFAVNAMSGFAVVVLQVDEAAGELDERFVKDVALSVRPESDVFEDIVGRVILLRVEEAEVFEVARMESAVCLHARHARGNALMLAHGDQAASSAA